MHDPDGDLIGAIAAGDAAAARELLRRRMPRVHALAQRMLGDLHEAEDVAQETFLRAWREAARWRPGAAKFETWLHRVTLNLCYDRLRKRRSHADSEAALAVADATPNAVASLLARQRAARVRAALAALPERQRAAITLCFFEEVSQTEAAAALEVSVDALESLLARGRRTLRAALAGVASDLLGDMGDGV